MTSPLPDRDSTADTDVEWRVAEAPVPYEVALAWMEERAAAVAAGRARECIWLLEHPPLYTSGTSANAAELLDPRFPVHAAGRGGRYTYHGPGQRIGYLILDIGKRGRDVRAFVHAVEGWIIDSLADLDVQARRVPGRIGIWTDDNGQEAKIGAIGIRLRRWVSMHGFSVNIDPDLTHFSGIVPCGIADHGVTSVAQLGKSAALATFDHALWSHMPGFMEKLSPHSSSRNNSA